MTRSSTSFTAKASPARATSSTSPLTHNIVDKSGAWYSYSGDRIGQGRENVRKFLKENRDTFTQVDTQLRQKLGITTASVPPAEVPAVPPNGAADAKEAVKPSRRG